MSRKCRQCGGSYEVTDEDLKFLERLSPDIPPPTLCPDCRQQRRLAIRNERYLHRRKCDLCGKGIVSFFDEKVEFPVYCVSCWWSDKWDPMDYGRDYEFGKPFFEQFSELLHVVPKMGMLQVDNENSEYNALLAFSKNTYMSPGSYFMEDCYYCRKSQYCKDCLDCNFVDHSELLRSCINCKKCYGCNDMLNCSNCRDCSYMADCSGCKNCFMCASVTKKEYCFKNKKYSKEEYEKIVGEKFGKGSEELMDEFLGFSRGVPKKAQNQINCENCSGDYLQNCKNAHECYDCFDVEDCKYMVESVGVKDSMDLSLHDKDIELCYEVSSGGERNMRLKFSFCTIDSFDSDYLYSCFYLKESFGCDGFHSKNKNCILNKKYSEKEYKALKGRIIEEMLKRGEYGEFFPVENSLYAYNESLASEYFPMSKEEVLSRGWKWREKDPKEYKKVDVKVPKLIGEVADGILKEVLACEECGKNYKILDRELKLCKKMNVNLSCKCPECRHMGLLALKNPRKLYERKCAGCGVEVNTTYDKNRPEKVYCEKCYLGEVY
ncbi:MAG: hypothetical protein V1679_01580 [Candidatus Peregrinibacteria bacterium]